MRLDKQLTEAEQEQIVNNYRKKIDEEAATKRDELKRQKKLLDKVNQFAIAYTFTKVI